MLKFHLGLLICFCIVILSHPVLAEDDPVIQIIEKALAEYKKQDFTNAATNLDYASQLIRQKKGEALGDLLPEPLSGWTANESSAEVTTAALFGGGLSAERVYSKKNAQVTISILTDSPLMQSMIMMFSNPIFAAASGQFELINGHKGIVSHKNNSGNIDIIINNRFLITLQGRAVSRDDLLSYARAINLEAVAALP